MDKKTIQFTEKKFCTLPLNRQHRKCMNITRIIYDCLLSNNSFVEILDHYNEIQSWMGAEPLLAVDKKSVSDRFHHHLQESGHSLKEHNLLPNITNSDRSFSEKPWPIGIYLDNIRSAFNVGSIIRTCEGLALGEVYFSKKTPFIDYKQVQDASMGAHSFVNSTVVTNINELPRPIIALETSEEAVSIHDFIFPEKFTLILGNEEYGCSDESLKLADHIVFIPMRGRKNSLNVANAFSMIAQEITRQRQSPIRTANDKK
ncbi:MAG: TrmH family RNA methyltransferase [Chlamydiota bacterium]|nr:TrmH family RNA methyltransferase [Chlamydiota bacterium]